MLETFKEKCIFKPLTKNKYSLIILSYVNTELGAGGAMVGTESSTLGEIQG